jgi:hypothetical protein
VLTSFSLTNLVTVVEDAREFVTRSLSVGEDEVTISFFYLLTKVLLIEWMVDAIAFTVCNIPAVVPPLLITHVEAPLLFRQTFGRRLFLFRLLLLFKIGQVVVFSLF